MGDWNIVTEEGMCNKGLNWDHRWKGKAVKHHFKDWIDAHDLNLSNIKYTFRRRDYKSRL